MTDKPDERLLLLNAYCIGVGGGTVLPQLCRRLAERGLLSSSDIETLRHSAVVGFDMLRERAPLSSDEKNALEAALNHLDSLWHRAARAAESQG
jgi:hypothetical protein